jgi:hypothetical protein
LRFFEDRYKHLYGALVVARPYVSKHDMRGHALRAVDDALWPPSKSSPPNQPF